MINEAWFGSFIGILGFLIGLISLILYLLSLRKPLLGTYIKGISLINNEQIILNKFEFLINSKKVKKLIKTSFYIWNKSSKTIRDTDIAQKDKLRITWSKDIGIYQIVIGKQNNKSTTITTDQNDKSIILNFDFLNKNDGFRVDIYHDAESSDFDIVGTVIGSKKSIIKKYKKEISKTDVFYQVYKIANSKVLSLVFILPVGLTFLFMTIFTSDATIIKLNEINDPNALRFTLLITSLMFLSLIPLRFVSSRYQYPENLEE